jgi:hypothetical protein
MYRKNKSINRLKHLKYRNIYIKIDRNRMLDIVVHYSYVWNLSQRHRMASSDSTVCMSSSLLQVLFSERSIIGGNIRAQNKLQFAPPSELKVSFRDWTK